MFDYVIARATANANIEQHCSFGPLRVLLKSDADETLLTVDQSGANLDIASPDVSVDLTLAATADAWAELRKPNAAPGFQTLSAMRRTQNLIVTGDMVKFQQHMMLLELLFANLGCDAPITVSTDGIEPSLEPFTGRYLRLSLDGRTHRIYFEEAGPADGIPLICLHTAGSDGRQYRHILNDPAITDRYRVIAFDLPWHGKSSPPEGFQKEVYQLTTDRYMATVLAVSDALKLDRPVVMGCSIGGRVVLHLAMRHASRFRAVIGLQSALYAEDRSLGDPAPDSPLHRPDVHGPKQAGASMAGMTAPQSPPAERWETMWHYMQGGPGIFAGDLNYYFSDGDLRNGKALPLRDSSCPVYLLSGEYDVSATPEMGREVAELIGAAHFEVMKDVGHFPMSENPASFRGYILPVLEKIAAAS
ncbi:MAG: pimeloyl-ACP methyl ester carboxylesterase [Hyphomicrobiaceae bacterium]|jgi:pimeloyl-ACP methyl ester carboxylesterase